MQPHKPLFQYTRPKSLDYRRKEAAKKAARTEKKHQLESIWNTYRSMAYLIAEEEPKKVVVSSGRFKSKSAPEGRKWSVVKDAPTKPRVAPTGKGKRNAQGILIDDDPSK